MKQFAITLKSDNGPVTISTMAQDVQSAMKQVTEAENAPMSAIMTWRVVPTKRQVQRTKNLMRAL